MIGLQRYQSLLDEVEPQRRSGEVRELIGLSVLASGPAVPVGELCTIAAAHGPQQALVVGFREEGVLLQPMGRMQGIRLGDRVDACNRGLDIPVGPGLIGRVIDGLGRPLDDGGPIPGKAFRPVLADPPPALSRPPIETVLETGVKVVDATCTIGRGQRMGIFAGPGLGKSVLLGEMAKHATSDVNVIALVGERGREVGEFLLKVLGVDGLKRSVVIAATSDRPAVERLSAAYAAHAIAEHFRDAGLDVLLMMDSVTRFCHAQRELGLAAGEPPTVRGYPPSAFALLPGLLERAGTSAKGSVTGLYTVLVDGDEDEDPVADNVRAIIDGHLVLSRQLANRAVFPAVDISKSVSRLLVDIAAPEEARLAMLARESWGEYERVRELVEIGAYQPGSDPRVDAAIARQPQLIDFIRQDIGLYHSRSDSLALLATALGAAPSGAVSDG